MLILIQIVCELFPKLLFEFSIKSGLKPIMVSFCFYKAGMCLYLLCTQRILSWFFVGNKKKYAKEKEKYIFAMLCNSFWNQYGSWSTVFTAAGIIIFAG